MPILLRAISFSENVCSDRQRLGSYLIALSFQWKVSTRRASVILQRLVRVTCKIILVSELMATVASLSSFISTLLDTSILIMAVQQAPSHLGRLVCLFAFLLLLHSGYSTFERKDEPPDGQDDDGV